MPKVLTRSKAAGDPEREVWIARPSKWGNPFSHKPGTAAAFRVATLDEAIASYEAWIQTKPDLMAALHELEGKDLVCWCAPAPCHGDVLLRLANKQPPPEEQTSLF